jgi:hypothetical protein
MGFYSFFNDGLKVDWRDRAEVAHRFVLVFRWFFGLLLIHMVPILFGRFVVVERHFLRVVHALLAGH